MPQSHSLSKLLQKDAMLSARVLAPRNSSHFSNTRDTLNSPRAVSKTVSARGRSQPIPKYLLARGQLRKPALHQAITNQVFQCPNRSSTSVPLPGRILPAGRGLLCRAPSSCQPSSPPALQLASHPVHAAQAMPPSSFACRRGSCARPWFPRWSSFKNPESAWR